MIFLELKRSSFAKKVEPMRLVGISKLTKFESDRLKNKMLKAKKRSSNVTLKYAMSERLYNGPMVRVPDTKCHLASR